MLNGSTIPMPYNHGWKNGRDDRIGKPRDGASVLRARADLIINSEA
jgi:hypothetical protein